MENLREKVYECSLAVEAHMICDLLARAGISARVDGEFLAGAGGELPLGSTITVRVDPSRAAEARQVIDEWQRTNPAEPTPPPPRSRVAAPLWFVFGGLCGAIVTFFALRAGLRSDVSQYETLHYSGNVVVGVDTDRNRDGRADMLDHYNADGTLESYELDEDFDGHFEARGTWRDGMAASHEIDQDGDGRPEQLWKYEHGALRHVDILDENERRLVVRQGYRAGVLTHAEVDQDGDSIFERRVDFDRYGLPR